MLNIVKSTCNLAIKNSSKLAVASRSASIYLNVNNNNYHNGKYQYQKLNFYSTSNKPNEDSKKTEYKSIIDDDLMEQAGINTDSKTESENQQSKFSSSSEKKRTSDDELYEQPRRRRNLESSLDKKKDRLAKMFWFAFLGSAVAGAGYLAREWDEVEDKELYNAEENGYSAGKLWTRFSKRLTSVTGLFSEPAFDDLLPPPLPEGYRPPLTLVLELDDFLLHSEWSQKKGWRTAKRPGLDYFLGYLSQYYEIVIFTKSPMSFAETTVAKLDPYHAFISYALFREACRYKDGKIIKDLSLMNRDLSKLLIVDPNPDSYSMQPENAVPVKKWEGGKDDDLIKLIPFLEYMATHPISDVRKVIASFPDKTKIPEEFARREKLLREKWAKEHTNNNVNIMGSLLGMAPSPSQNKMPLDLIREQGQKNYAHMNTYLKENGEKLLKEEQEKTKEFMADQKFTLGKLVTEGMPNAEEIAKQQAEMQAKSQ
ncbi:hypothetical protein B5S32_g3843 [[Candida] boidinii]|nr:hypothetical protein B5S32_g3843 [[Candida] boidinii]